MKNKLIKWKHFNKDIILVCVRWYLKYSLSFRDLEEIMLERGIDVSHSTILRWTHQYSPIIEEKIRNHIKLTNDS